MKLFTNGILLAAALLLLTMKAAAQNDNKVNLDSIISAPGPFTWYLLDEDFRQIEYSDTVLRAGIVMENVFAVSDACDIETPDDTSVRSALSTVYGSPVWDEKADLDNFFEELRYTEGSALSITLKMLNLLQGGVYKYKMKFPALNIDKEEELVFNDVANMRKTGRTICNVGEIDKLSMQYIFNTGYPYNQDTLQAQNKVKFQLFSVDKENQKHVIDEREKTFSLLDREKPLVAGIDTVAYDGFGLLEELGPGEYYLNMSCDWNNIERTSLVIVNDTLRAEMKLDKDIYVQGEDKKAKVYFKMDYGYPYIHAADDEQLPTVSFFTQLRVSYKDDNVDMDTTYIDSVSVSDSKFAEEHVCLEKEIEIDLERVLENYVFENDVDTLSLRASIHYEGEMQKEDHLKLLVKRVATSVKYVQAAQGGSVEYYNLNGQRITVPNRKNVLYIKRRDGKAVLEKW